MLQSNRQDQVIVQWGATQESAILQIVVVHALVILLCHVPPSGDCFFSHGD